MRIARLLFFPAALLVTVSACFTQNASTTTASAFVDSAKYYFKNPIGKGADPWITKSGKYYYVCQTGQGGIVVKKSDKLTKMGAPKLVWKPDPGRWNSNCVWAPELHHIGKKWYIYYAAGQSGPPYIHQRSGVLESVTDDPQGAYIDKGMLKTGDDPADSTKTIWAIDVNFFR